MTLETHGACGRIWTQRGNRTSHCADCHQTFSTLTSFDDHRSGDWSARACATPIELYERDGLTRDPEGVWWTPEGLANLYRLQVAGEALAAHAPNRAPIRARSAEQAAPVLPEGSAPARPSETRQREAATSSTGIPR